MNRRRYKEPAPERYQVLEYIRANGAARCELHYLLTANDDIEAEWLYQHDVINNDVATNVSVLIQGGWSNGYTHLGGIYANSTHKYLDPVSRWTGGGVGIYNGTVTYQKNTLYHTFLKGSTGVITINGVNKSVNYNRANAANDLLIIGNNEIANKAIVDIKYIKISRSSVVTVDLLPVRRMSDNELGMYDRVSGKFYTNRGTGTFIAGNATGEIITYINGSKVEGFDCDAPGELGYDNPMKAKFIGYKKVEDTDEDFIKIVDRLWDYKRGQYNTITGEFIKDARTLFLRANFPREWNGMHVTYNQLLQGTDFANITDVSRYWRTQIGFIKSVEDGYVEVEKNQTSAANAGVSLQQKPTMQTTHKYFLSAENVGNPNYESRMGFMESHTVGVGGMVLFDNGYASAIMQPAISNLYFSMRLGTQTMPNGETDKFTRPRMIDLTTFFKGNIPENLTAEQMTEYMPNLILEYNKGTECVIYNGDLYLAL